MIDNHIDHAGIHVVNLEESIEFYQTVFDFSVIQRWESPRHVFIGTDVIVLSLIEVPDTYFSAHSMAHLAFPCRKNHFNGIVKQIKQTGYKIVSGPFAQRGGEAILFHDPSGNLLEVCYPSMIEWLQTRTQVKTDRAFSGMVHNSRGTSLQR